jgi:hypothetical protein
LFGSVDQLVAGRKKNSDMVGARFEVSSDTGAFDPVALEIDINLLQQ